MVLDTQSVHAAAGAPPPRPAGTRRRRCQAASEDWRSTYSGSSSPSSSSPRTRTTTPRASPCWTKSPGTPAAQSRRFWSTRASRTRSSRIGAGLSIDVEIVARNPQEKGFVPQPKRRKVEQTYGILILHRRLVRDYDHHPSSSASRVYWTHVMARRLTGTNTPTWREPKAVAA